MTTKISVIIPTYQRIGLLSKCLDALKKQTFNKDYYEIIVVSDGPDLKTRDLMTAIIRRSKVSLLHKELPCKKGPAAARNLGWLQAKGQIVAFTDDDCLPSADWLEQIWNAYNGEEYIAFCGKVVVPLSPAPTDFELNTSRLERAEFVTANCACTKKALIKTGGFDERFVLAWREDSDLHFNLLLHHIPVNRIDATVVHPVRQAGWGVSLAEQKKGMFNALLYKKYPGLYKNKVGSKAPWHYYTSVFSFIGLLLCIATKLWLATLICLAIWLFFTVFFTYKRLESTSRSVDHVLEMIVTSGAIPFLSVYWQLYGAWKYRVLFF